MALITDAATSWSTAITGVLTAATSAVAVALDHQNWETVATEMRKVKNLHEDYWEAVQVVCVGCSSRCLKQMSSAHFRAACL